MKKKVARSQAGNANDAVGTWMNCLKPTITPFHGNKYKYKRAFSFMSCAILLFLNLQRRRRVRHLTNWQDGLGGVQSDCVIEKVR